MPAPIAPVAPSPPATRQAVTFAGGLLLGISSALAFRGLLRLDTLAAAPFEKSPALPHLALLVTNLRQAVLEPALARLIVPGALVAHAVFIGLAGAVGTIATQRARNAAWTPWLVLALGTTSFYLAQFSFVHPAARMETATGGLLLLDFAAAVGLGLGLWSAVRFFTRFPGTFDVQAYENFQVARFREEEAKGAASRFAWRRWLARHQAESRAKNLKVDRWRASLPLRLQAAMSAPFFGTLIAVALALALNPLRRAGAAPVLPILSMFMALMALTMTSALSLAVLAWHAKEGAPAVRSNARLLLHGITATLALLPVGMFGGMTLGAVLENWRVMTISMLSLPLGALLVMLVVLILLGITTWRATEGPSSR